MSRIRRNDPFDGGSQIGTNDIDPDFGITVRRLQRLRTVLERRQPNLHLVLENVHDPHNVSAVIRTCDAVGVGTLHLVYTYEPFPRIGKSSSSGAWKWIDVERHESVEACYDRLRSLGCTIFATDLAEGSVGLYNADLSGAVAIVFGNEHKGVLPEASALADANLQIPMFGLVQSLNISVACAVTLYEAMRQRMVQGLYDTPTISENAIENTLKQWCKM